jgi:acetyltransferase-like isoleucine patch superfamily enzyme
MKSLYKGIHSSANIHPTAKINCKSISIGEGASIGENCIIEGSTVSIGRNFWMDVGAIIGGGSCHDPKAFLKAGDFLHMGRGCMVNLARGVTIGDEVGLGINTQIFTHGAYLNELNGFPAQFAPVSIGSQVWIPNATINPGVNIGSNVVIAGGSVVNSDIKSGCLAGGIPAKVIKDNFYPKEIDASTKATILNSILNECSGMITDGCCTLDGLTFIVDTTQINCENYTITGPVTADSKLILNQLRRHGIRFKYSILTDFIKWKD